MNALGADFIEATREELNRLRIDNGVKVSKLSEGKLERIGIKQGFIITSIDKKKVSTVDDIKNILSNKTGSVTIEGYYPNGARAYYGFEL